MKDAVKRCPDCACSLDRIKVIVDNIRRSNSMVELQFEVLGCSGSTVPVAGGPIAAWICPQCCRVEIYTHD